MTNLTHLIILAHTRTDLFRMIQTSWMFRLGARHGVKTLSNLRRRPDRLAGRFAH